MNLKNYAFVVLVIVGLAACKKNRSDNPEQKSIGEDTKISLSLSIASSGTKTYAPSEDNEDNATVSELSMKTVDIFIYDNVSPFALTHKHFEDKDAGIADFEDGTVEDGALGTRRLKNGIVLDAKTGSKMIYVGVNLPESFVTQIKATQGLASLEGVFSTLELYDGDGDNLNSNGMPMFTIEGKVAPLGKNDLSGIPATNQVSLKLTRMLAKVEVDGTAVFNNLVVNAAGAGNLLPVVGGKIDVSTLRYTLNQVNDKTYLKGNGIIPGEKSNLFFDRDVVGTGLGTISKYVPENRAENDLATLTYAVVEARFVPEVFEDEGMFTYIPGTFFFTVTDKSNGSVKYYINSAQAGLDLDVNTANKEFRLYNKGLCYYHIYLNPENDHKVIRNEYYQVKISNIRGIGKSSPSAAVLFGSPLSLYNPELINTIGGLIAPYNPTHAATNANIEATVTIVPWKMVVFEQEL